MLIRIAQCLGVDDVASLTNVSGTVFAPSQHSDLHHVVPAVRSAMREAAFCGLGQEPNVPFLDANDLARDVTRLWRIWHTSPMQRSVVGERVPILIRRAHASMSEAEDDARRDYRSAIADLYRLVQRLLAHICEPELHALAVERGRAYSEESDNPLTFAEAAWASAVDLCASGHYDDSAELARKAVTSLIKSHGGPSSPTEIATIGALQLEAAAAHALAGHEGDAYYYLDSAAATAKLMPSTMWHLPSGFNQTNVEILGVMVRVNLRRNGEAILAAEKIDLSGTPSVVRRSRLLLEVAQAHANRRDQEHAVRTLSSAADLSLEAVALIPWARTLADELADGGPGNVRSDARRLGDRLKSVV